MSMDEIELVLHRIPDMLQRAHKTRDQVTYYDLAKRVFDLIIALIGLLVLSLPMLMITVFIKLEDPRGTVFFSQIRIGKNGRTFKIYKFRSMVSNAEDILHGLLDRNEVSGAMFKIKNDPRITKVGLFIRKTSLDELPQLWNVILGDMSIVGPRPPLPREIMEYSEKHFERLSVIPGCTGLWQVSARNSVGFEEMVELDMKYIKYRSLFLDIKIVIKTITIVLLGSKNAF